MGNIRNFSNIPMSDEKDNESLNETLKRFISVGVHQNKIILTKQTSMVIWSKSRKCLVGGDSGIEPLEVYTKDGKSILGYENNQIISLQNRSELGKDDIDEINNSDGIIVTNATYGKPYFRYGFIPK